MLLLSHSFLLYVTPHLNGSLIVPLFRNYFHLIFHRTGLNVNPPNARKYQST